MISGIRCGGRKQRKQQKTYFKDTEEITIFFSNIKSEILCMKVEDSER